MQEHIPIWVAGYGPNKRPFRRAAQWDGAAPAEMAIRPEGFAIVPRSPETMAAVKAYIDQHRPRPAPYDLIVSRTLPESPAAAAALVRAFEAAGVTWLLRDLLPWEVSLAQAFALVRAGPARP